MKTFQMQSKHNIMKDQSHYEINTHEEAKATKKPMRNSRKANIYFGIGVFCLVVFAVVFCGILYHGIINL